ncbi:uncharacterized protein LOC141638449 [Silene latifolia]|uniref:uncharacterized protein LOC141638449 n=1 Tax=Silene latifolia TaxID=37657 RepID=UPI003D770998
MEQKFDDDDDEEDGRKPDLHECTHMVGNKMFYLLPYLLTRKDFERTDIYRLIPSLECEDAARLTRAIEKKLSSESAFLKTSAKKEKHQLVRFPMVSSRSFEPSVRSIHTSAGSANPMFGVKFTPNKVIQSSKLKCLKDLGYFSQIFNFFRFYMAQRISELDANDDKMMLKRRNRSVLIHGTLRKQLLPTIDMKENMAAPKRMQMVNATATKPGLKRKDLRKIWK